MALLIILVSPNLTLASVNKATLINSQGKKLVITVGSAIPYGYKLYTPTKIGASNINNFQTVTVTSTTTVAGNMTILLPRNGGRKFAVISNVGATTTYLAFDNATSSISDNNFVIPLPVNTSYTINLDNLYTGQIVASSSASTKIRSFEANY